MKISILYCFIEFLIRKLLKVHFVLGQLFISVFFLILGFLLHKTNFTLLSIDKVLSFYILFFLGFLIKKYSTMLGIIFGRTIFVRIITITICLSILLFCNQIGRIELVLTDYKNPLYFIVVSITGWLMVYQISYFLSKISVTRKLFTYLGRNTMPIVIFHFLCFKIISLVGIVKYKLPLYLIACYPTTFRDEWWWLAYLFIGISV